MLGQTKQVANEMLAYLNDNHRANPTGLVLSIIENTPAGQDILSFRHAGANVDWTT